MGKRRLSAQLAIWDDLPPQSGRTTARPWWVPHRAWDAARKRYERSVERGEYRNHARATSEIARRMRRHLRTVLAEEAKARKAIWVVLPEKPETPQLVREDVLVFPAATVGAATKRMVMEGRMAGLYWCDAGVMRVAHAVRVRA